VACAKIITCLSLFILGQIQERETNNNKYLFIGVLTPSSAFYSLTNEVFSLLFKFGISYKIIDLESNEKKFIEIFEQPQKKNNLDGLTSSNSLCNSNLLSNSTEGSIINAEAIHCSTSSFH
jgi:hypothetical protein